MVFHGKNQYFGKSSDRRNKPEKYQKRMKNQAKWMKNQDKCTKNQGKWRSKSTKLDQNRPNSVKIGRTGWIDKINEAGSKSTKIDQAGSKSTKIDQD